MSPGSPAFKPAVLSLAAIPEHELFFPIASGAYGQVWIARNRLGVHRAVKIVHRSSFDHDRPFEREFAGIKAFEPVSRSHEGLVDLLQVGRDDGAGYFYYVMELADNLNSEGKGFPDITAYTPRTLASELKRRGKLPLRECIEIGLSLTDALAYLHGQGLVHRDIKPSNIIFVGGVPKLADVGLVAPITDARSFVGTEGFIPPEGPGTAQADLYSVGIVLYVLSTGKSHQDFPEPPTDLLDREDHAQWLEFDAVVNKACQANARERYQSAQEMKEDLALLQRGQSVKKKRAVRRRWGIARKLGAGAAAVGLAIALSPLVKRAKHPYSPNPEAAWLYERGRWYYSQLTPAAHAKALEYLTQATKADPKFVKPYGELTALYTWNQVPDSNTEEKRLHHTQEIANKAFAVDPNAAEGHTALSWCRFLQRDWHGAEDEIQRAIRINPGLPIAHDIYCFYLSMQGRTDEARREGNRAEELDTGSERVTAIVASMPYVAERRFDLAIAQLKRGLELDPTFAQFHLRLGVCYDAQSNYIAAIQEYKTHALLVGLNEARVNTSYDALRRAYDEQGEPGYLRKWIELIRADEVLPDDQQLFYEMDIIGYYARLGEKAKALRELETHFNEPQNWHKIKFLPMYDSLHNEERYQKLVWQAGLQP